jgi:hypothetical protein
MAVAPADIGTESLMNISSQPYRYTNLFGQKGSNDDISRLGLLSSRVLSIVW